MANWTLIANVYEGQDVTDRVNDVIESYLSSGGDSANQADMQAVGQFAEDMKATTDITEPLQVSIFGEREGLKLTLGFSIEKLPE